MDSAECSQYYKTKYEEAKNSAMTLHYACEMGEVETVVAFLTNGEDANQLDREGKSPLHFACNLTDEELIEALLKHGADATLITSDNKRRSNLHIGALEGSPSTLQLILEHVQPKVSKEEFFQFLQLKDSFGKCAIHWAAENGYTECVSVLLSYGANINEKDSSGKTTLHHCAAYGIEYPLELLLSFGANVNELDSEGRTALHLACIGKYKFCVNLLISNGSNILQQDNEGMTPLHYSCMNGDFEVIELLILKASELFNSDITTIKDHIGRTVLHAAAASGSVKCCKYLLEKNLSLLKEIDAYGRSAVTWGVHVPTTLNNDFSFESLQIIWNMWEVDSKLVNENDFKNSAIFNPDKFGRNPLHYSCFFRHYPSTEFLLEKGVNALQVDEFGRTPPHYSAHSRKFLELFHSKNIDLQVRDLRGCTPLMLTCFYGNFSALIYCVEQLKFDHLQVDLSQRNLLHYLALNTEITAIHCEKFIRYLIERGLALDASDKSGVTPLHLAAGMGNLSFLSAIVTMFNNREELRYYFNIEDFAGRQPIHYSAIQNQSEALAFLITHGSEISARDNQHLTPLHHIVLHNHIDCALSFLTSANTDLTQLINHEGKSPLIFAIHSSFLEMVDTLLFYDNAADPNLADNAGNTPLHYAVIVNNPSIMRVLIDHNALPAGRNKHNVTPLHLAVCCTDIACLTLLLSLPLSEEELNAEDCNSRSPLHWAVICGNFAAVELLLANPEVKVGALDQQLRSPLHYAVAAGSLPIVKLLLFKSDSVVNMVDKNGASALMLAAFYQRYDILQLLIHQSKASVQSVDHLNRNAVRYAKYGAKKFGKSHLPSLLSLLN